MNRRKFINKSGKLAIATVLPYILPTGSLFAATEDPKVKHVVFCLFAGGIRRWESIDLKDGNLMPNTLVGNKKIAEDISPAIQPMPKVLKEPLQTKGTLFKGFKYNSTFTHHFPAHKTAISGKYYYTNEMYQPIRYPSVFEYFRKHSSFGQDAINTWWVADKPGDFPYMQYSKDPNYGVKYAANMIQPSNIFKNEFSENWSDKRIENAHKLQSIISKHRPKVDDVEISNALNSKYNQKLILEFLKKTKHAHFLNEYKFWEELDSNLINLDIVNMFAACEVLKTFHPNLLVVNMQDSDIGHFNFSDYCNNLHKADYALAKLWQTIQEDPVLKDNTVLIAQPEFGRNALGNGIVDEYGRIAVDHSGDEVSQQCFCLIAGPPDIIHQNKVVDENIGEVIDTVPTIAHLMGFRKLIPEYYLQGQILHDALV